MKEINLNIPVIDKTQIDLIVSRESMIDQLNDEIDRVEADGGDSKVLKKERKALRDSRSDGDQDKKKLFDGKFETSLGDVEWTENSITYRRMIIYTDKGKAGIAKIIADIQAAYSGVQVERVWDGGLDLGVNSRPGKIVDPEEIIDAGTTASGKPKRYHLSARVRTPLIDGPTYPPLHAIDPARPSRSEEVTPVDDDGEELPAVAETRYSTLPRKRGLPARLEV